MPPQLVGMTTQVLCKLGRRGDRNAGRGLAGATAERQSYCTRNSKGLGEEGPRGCMRARLSLSGVEEQLVAHHTCHPSLPPARTQPIPFPHFISSWDLR